MKRASHPVYIALACLCAFFLGRLSTNSPAPRSPADGTASSPEQLQTSRGPSPAPTPPASTPPRDSGEGLIPSLSELPASILAKLSLSMLRPDLSLDPSLQTIANLTPEQMKALQETINEHQSTWAMAESKRAIALENTPHPTVLIPPLTSQDKTTKSALQNKIAGITGPGKGDFVWRLLSNGLEHATGDFGISPRLISFETTAEESGPFRVRVGSFHSLMKDFTEENPFGFVTDWQAFAQDYVTKTTPPQQDSFTFKTLPPQFAPFIESTKKSPR